MSKYKYQEITEALAAAVERGEYRERLPSVRLLGELFQANSRTVLQALQELAARGVVVPNGNRGYLVNRCGNPRPVTGNIVVFSQNDPEIDRMLRPAPRVLEQLCAKAGKRLIALNTSDGTLCGMRNFWQTLGADGVIFLNSTLDREAAYQLKLSGIPFVAANRMPREWGVNYVDFDHETALKGLFTRLIRQGKRRIAMLNTRFPLNYFREIVFSAYSRVMNDYAIFDPELFSYPEAGDADELYLANSILRWTQMRLPPDALYSSVPPYLLFRALDQAGLRLPEELPLHFAYSSGIWEDAPEYPGIEYPYQLLTTRLWELLSGVIADPDRPPEGQLIPARLIRADGSEWQ
ncbi:MAG: GntR family transcriptional regulator [Lentisphaeria bacterium]|nr:GntR family transcriptional regulator [Lentisphaeria bacterium]